MRVGVIGMGRVGRFFAGWIEPYVEVITYDAATDPTYPTDDLAACDFAVICVDTPSRPDGGCDTTNVEAALRQLPVDRILLKSTVSPGTTARLVEETGKEICFSPEFIGESRYGNPSPATVGHVAFLILGGEPPIRRYFGDQLTRVAGPSVPIFQCASLEAELTKYMENAFLATKVTFVNEMYDVCRAFGADWATVREGWLLDDRMGRSHSAVFPDERGFGGKCLPKDVRAIIAAAAATGYEPSLLQAVLMANARFRGEEAPRYVGAPPARTGASVE